MGYADLSLKKFSPALPWREKPGSAGSGLVRKAGIGHGDELRLTSDFPQEIVALPFAFGDCGETYQIPN